MLWPGPGSHGSQHLSYSHCTAVGRIRLRASGDQITNTNLQETATSLTMDTINNRLGAYGYLLIVLVCTTAVYDVDVLMHYLVTAWYISRAGVPATVGPWLKMVARLIQCM